MAKKRKKGGMAMGKTTAEALPSSKKRKRQGLDCTTTGNESSKITPIVKKCKSSQPLNGLILAVSTLDVKGKKHSSSDSSYQAVSALCTELGAKVTPQVHKKVFGVICSQSAVNQLTQRVRKAMKKKHSFLIDIEWIRQCKLQSCKVNYEEYLLTELAEKALEKKSNNISPEIPIDSSTSCIHVQYEDNDDELISKINEGWTEPVSLDCCCVCHETDRDDCIWCVDCNVTRAKKNKLKT